MSATPLRVLAHGPAAGARNMALDEALLDGAREGRLTLRLYGWSPACLSLGRHQRARGRYDLETLAELGADVVRRPTGGRAVYHDREVTYAVTAPLALWGGLRPAYAGINRALARGLRALGVPARVGPEAEAGDVRRGSRTQGRAGEAPRGPRPEGRRGMPGTRACFRDPAAGEITADGRKLVGSAQWRERGALLQHGSILLEDQQALAERLRRDGPPGRAADGERPPAVGRGPAVGLAELLPRVPDRPRLLEALAAGFEAELGVRAVEGALEPEEEAAAGRLEPRYRDAEWTWRR